MILPLSRPDITDLEIAAVLDTLRSSQLSIGPRQIEFEERIAGYTGAAYAIAVSSGTAGLHLSLLALGIGPGDEVIVPSFTFIAAANTVRYVGATPVFVDIDSATLNMDPGSVRAAITPRTRALMVVHTFGVPAALDALQSIAAAHGLLLIEDACEAIGARHRGRPVGTVGHAGVFAFYPNKQLTTGEGGMILTKDPALAATLRALRNQGRTDGDSWHQHTLLGYNYRLPELSCALGCAQLQRIESILAARAAVAETYRAALARVPAVEPAVTLCSRDRDEGTTQSWFVYVLRLGDGSSPTLRDHVLRHMQQNGVQCGRYFAPVHQQAAYAGTPVSTSLAVTERESNRTLALPFFNRMTAADVDYVVCTLQTALAQHGSLHATTAD